jgi:virginiamycin B lyase
VKIRLFNDLPIYSGYYSPSAIAAGSDGNVWVTDVIDQDFGENVVVGIAPSGKRVQAFYYGGVTSEGASFDDLVSGPDGALWITDSYNGQILQLALQGNYTGFALPNFQAPFGIAEGPDKALWFTASSNGGGAIGRVTIKGHMTMYTLSHQTHDIAAGPDRALWFTEFDNDTIGRITTRGKITEFSRGITPGSQPDSIALGPDGALWFTENGGGRIGRITTAGKVTEYSAGITPAEKPNDIAAGPDGAMWFTEYKEYGSYNIQASKIGRITTHGKVTEYSKGLLSQNGPSGIAAGPDGNMWFVATRTNQTGRVRL